MSGGKGTSGGKGLRVVREKRFAVRLKTRRWCQFYEDAPRHLVVMSPWMTPWPFLSSLSSLWLRRIDCAVELLRIDYSVADREAGRRAYIQTEGQFP